MNNKILFVSNKKLPKQFEELKNDFDISTEKNILKAYKSVFVSTPDIIILNVSSIFETYHFSKLLEIFEDTKNIPLILMTGKNPLPTNIDFNTYHRISLSASYNDMVTLIDNIFKSNDIKKVSKERIAQLNPTNKQIKEKTSSIIDNLLISSSITDEFKSLIDSMNFENVLAENIFKIFKEYFSYDVAGLFFNNSDAQKRNVLNLSLPNKNIPLKTIDEIRDKFFDEMEKKKRINEIQCNLSDGDISEKGRLDYKSFKKVIILPFSYTEKLTGGLILTFKKEPDIYQTAFINVILHELDVIFKLKYIFNEQENHAVYDTMTGLFNRQEFEVNLDREFHRARRYIYNFTLAMLDIDHLSKINKQYGKEFGDFVITELAKLLNEVFRRTDLIYRYGSEEIIVLLPSTPITKSVIPIERLRDKISKHTFEKNGAKTNVTVSIGLCANYSKFTEPNQLLNAVGTALHRAKELGRNRVDIFE